MRKIAWRAHSWAAEKYDFYMRIIITDRFGNIQGRICRTVIGNNDLIAFTQLVENACHLISYISLPIICCYNHGNLRWARPYIFGTHYPLLQTIWSTMPV